MQHQTAEPTETAATSNTALPNETNKTATPHFNTAELNAAVAYVSVAPPPVSDQIDRFMR